MPFRSPYKQYHVWYSFSTLKRNKDILYTKETLKDTVTADVQVHMTRGQMFSFFKEIQLKEMQCLLYINMNEMLYTANVPFDI